MKITIPKTFKLFNREYTVEIIPASQLPSSIGTASFASSTVNLCDEVPDKVDTFFHEVGHLIWAQLELSKLVNDADKEEIIANAFGLGFLDFILNNPKVFRGKK